MEFLILSPPVCTPSEPPSGAFILASALTAHGFETGLLDLSLEFYYQVLFNSKIPGVSCQRALSYLQNGDLKSNISGYDPMRHRTEAGTINTKLKGFSKIHNGWKLSAMDIIAPIHVHNPIELATFLKTEKSPFADLWINVLDPVLKYRKPKNVLISLAYLSQLPAAIDLAEHLKKIGITPIVGGSLPRSLSQTGAGLNLLKYVFFKIDISNGASLVNALKQEDFLNKLSYPKMISDKEYLSIRPILPSILSIGCFWSKCLFCPDREMPFSSVSIEAIDQFLGSIPKEIAIKKPILHFLDSAMPPAQIRRVLPITKKYNVKFYGFARPTRHLLKNNLIEDAADNGCLMLQLGAESGSKNLLDVFSKGLNPLEAQRVIKRAANAGIKNYIYLLFGLPGESDHDRILTLKMIEENIDYVDFMNLSLFNLPKYCDLANRADDFGITIEEYHGDENTIHLYSPFKWHGLSPKNKSRKFLKDTFLQSSSIKTAHLRTPKWFRAAHVALMNIKNRSPV